MKNEPRWSQVEPMELDEKSPAPSHGEELKTIIVGRDQQKGRAVENELRAWPPNGQVYFLAADLSLTKEALR